MRNVPHLGVFWESRSNLKNSFTKIKTEVDDVYNWLNHLNHENHNLKIQLNHLNSLSQHQKNSIIDLHNQLSNLPKTREDIKKIIDSYYSFEEIINRINSLSHRIDILSNHPTHAKTQHLQELKEKVDTIKPKATVREKIIKRLTKNSREYVTRTIINYIKQYNSIPCSKLKEIIVEDQGLASKSSFYRMMENIEAYEDVGVMKKGKERHYFYKQTTTA